MGPVRIVREKPVNGHRALRRGRPHAPRWLGRRPLGSVLRVLVLGLKRIP